MRPLFSSFFFFNDTATTEIYTLSLHDALPISLSPSVIRMCFPGLLCDFLHDRACCFFLEPLAPQLDLILFADFVREQRLELGVHVRFEDAVRFFNVSKWMILSARFLHFHRGEN